MLVASNTSPICNLSIIGRLNLLRTQFHEILIPEAVRTELDRLSHANASMDIHEAFRAGWLRIQAIRDDKVTRLLKATLDPGEAEAIALALEVAADLILGRGQKESGCENREPRNDCDAHDAPPP